MTKDEFDVLLPLKVPPDVAICPICGAGVVIGGVDDYSEDGDQMRIDEDSSISIDCETAPDIDSDDFDDYMHGHWSMPYVDWMPVEKHIGKWLNDRLVNGDLANGIS